MTWTLSILYDGKGKKTIVKQISQNANFFLKLAVRTRAATAGKIIIF
jgi:hypothetical protein